MISFGNFFVARLVVFAMFILLACLVERTHAAYDLEIDIGVVAENRTPEVATANAIKLTQALNAQWPGGKFKFAGGRVGPVLDEIHAKAKEFFFIGTVSTSPRNGCCLTGVGTPGYLLPSDSYNHGPQGGLATRFTWLQPCNCLRLRGSGAYLKGFEIRGRPYYNDGTGEGALAGSKAISGIEVEGRTDYATGHHHIADVLIDDCVAGIICRAGYYDDFGKFIPCENHADTSYVDVATFCGCDSCWKSENQQALCWGFNRIIVGGFGGRGHTHTTFLDVLRGGQIVAHDVNFGHNDFTVLRVRDYSPNQSSIDITGFTMDGMGKPGTCTLFEYDGPSHAGDTMDWVHWRYRVTGFIPWMNVSVDPKINGGKPMLDPLGYVSINDKTARVGIRRSDIQFDISNLPLDGFVPVAGSWVRPKDNTANTPANK